MTKKNVIHVPRPICGMGLGTFTDFEEAGFKLAEDLAGSSLAEGKRPKGRVTIVDANPRTVRIRMTIARACRRGLGRGTAAREWGGRLRYPAWAMILRGLVTDQPPTRRGPLQMLARITSMVISSISQDRM